jgi:hypothetical protein
MEKVFQVHNTIRLSLWLITTGRISVHAYLKYTRMQPIVGAHLNASGCGHVRGHAASVEAAAIRYEDNHMN